MISVADYPNSIYLELTPACNNHCFFCYLGSNEMAAKAPPLDMDHVREIVRQLTSMPSVNVMITGGEPLLCSEVVEIANGLCDGCGGCTVLTNGMLLRPEHMSIFDKRTGFSISLHGADSKTHDAMVGNPGSFTRVIRQITALKDNGFVVNVNSVVTKETIERVPQLITLAESLHVDSVTLARFVPVGSGEAFAERSLSRLELEDLVSIARAGAGIPISLNTPLPFCGLDDYVSCGEYIPTCSAGLNTIAIDCLSGDAKFCVDSSVVVGNAFQTPVKDIWQHSPILNSYRAGKYLPRECRGCEFLDKCRGGCRVWEGNEQISKHADGMARTDDKKRCETWKVELENLRVQRREQFVRDLDQKRAEYSFRLKKNDCMVKGDECILLFQRGVLLRVPRELKELCESLSTPKTFDQIDKVISGLFEAVGPDVYRQLTFSLLHTFHENRCLEITDSTTTVVT